MVPVQADPSRPVVVDREYAAFAIRYQPVLFAIARNICGRSASDCEDLVQDVLLRALLKWDRLQGLSDAALRAWVGRVLKNCFLDRCRRQGAEEVRVNALSNVTRLFVEPEDAQDLELWECITEEELRTA